MAEAATLEQTIYEVLEAEELARPEVYVVPEMETDELVRRRAARFIGAAILGNSDLVEVCSVEKPIESLYDAIHLAKEGDASARKLIETNVSTDVIERTIKTGHVMSKVPLIISQDGKVSQYGQSMDSIQANSLRYAAENEVMRERTEAETRNAFRIEQLHREGFFEDYSFVVISRAENLPEAGFFIETMSCSIQVTSKSSGGLAMESAFVAGKAQTDGPQHDAETVVALGQKLNIDFEGKTPAEIIDTPVLIHNSLIPNGVIDLVKLYDDCAGGTFFGEAKPRQNYQSYKETCRTREQTYGPKVQAITNELIRNSGDVDSPVAAVELLHKLSGKHMVEYAVIHTSIDPRVFGIEAAPSIELARFNIENGDLQSAARETKKAQVTQTSTSCPSGRVSKENKATDGNDGEDKKAGKKWMNCPFCSAKVFDDPCATRLECGDCKAKVVNGKVVSTGDGGVKARAERDQVAAHQREAKRVEAEKAMAKQVDTAFKAQGIDSSLFDKSPEA